MTLQKKTPKRKLARDPHTTPPPGLKRGSIGVFWTVGRPDPEAIRGDLMDVRVRLNEVAAPGGVMLRAVAEWAVDTLAREPPADWAAPRAKWPKRAQRAAGFLDRLREVLRLAEAGDLWAVADAAFGIARDVTEAELAPFVEHARKLSGRKPGAKGVLARVAEWIAAETGGTSLRDAADFLRSLVPDEPYELPDGTVFELGSIDAEEDGVSLRDVRLRYYLGGKPYKCKLNALRPHLEKVGSGKVARSR